MFAVTKSIKFQNKLAKEAILNALKSKSASQSRWFFFKKRNIDYNLRDPPPYSACYEWVYVLRNQTNPRDICGLCGGDNSAVRGGAG